MTSVRDYAIFTTDREGRVTSWPAGAAAVYGWSEAEILGRSVDVTFVPEDVAKGEPEKEQETALREGVAPNIRWHLRKDGARIFINGSTQPLVGADGMVCEFIKIGQDVTEARRVQTALAESERRLRTLMGGIPQLVWRSGDEGRWTWSSPQWQAYTGQSEEESHGLGWLDAVHPEDRDRTVAAWHAARSHGQLEVEYRIRRAADGIWRWHQTRSVPVRDSPTAEQLEGCIAEWLGTTTDIEDLKRLQAEQGVLVAELQHRTRNLLAVVRNVARRSIPPQPGRDEYDARLAALGRVQGFLARSSAHVVPLRNLVEAELQAAGDGSSDRVTVEGPPVNLPGEGAQPVALALHELATNAVKYGAIAQPSGRLSVTWRVEEWEGGPRLRIAWRESGVAMPDGRPARRGYGSELISQALPYQMGAETALDFTPDGVSCDIILPASAFRTAEDRA
ncbi:sensor histidine kinase [Muricoccus radiodurans]|uniref:sensor histidine kinase n=1 Tax=Muricoccus radiodurans TaxID=2231721 RepID=UPI003CEFD7F1